MLRKICQTLKDNIDNTNSKHLELYSIMGEYDNAGFPLTYCLLSTATAIDLGKRKKALAIWLKCLRDKYSVDPIFIHTDKDMGEIGSSWEVWEAKINLCWWHLRWAVRTRLAKAKLATTPYNIDRAVAEFNFISANFIPPGTQIDVGDYEGGILDAEQLPTLVNTMAPVAQPGAIQLPQHPPPLQDSMNLLRIKLALPNIASAVGRMIQGVGFKLSIAPTCLPTIEEEDDEEDAEEDAGAIEKETEMSSDEDEGTPGRRTFCPTIYREPIVNMMERHYCAHPSIPGYGPPDAIGIKRWAAKQMYNFCTKHELPKVWAYLWENWYRRGRWELWACCGHKLIPILKTMMILESQ